MANAGLIIFGFVLTTLVPGASSQSTDASSHCSYLVGAASRYQPNSAAFKIYTRSRSPRITSGEPIEGKYHYLNIRRRHWLRTAQYYHNHNIISG